MQWNKAQIIVLIQTIGKIGGAALATRAVGQADTDLWQAGIGIAICFVSWWFSHHAVASPGASGGSPGAIVGGVVALLGLLWLSQSGCVSADNGRIISGIQSNGIGLRIATPTATNLWQAGIGIAICFVSWWFSHHAVASPGASGGSPGAIVGVVALLGLLWLSQSGCVSAGNGRIIAGIQSNGIGLRIATPTATNSFKLVVPLNLSNILQNMIVSEF
jgi:uncharacterized membrane protein